MPVLRLRTRRISVLLVASFLATAAAPLFALDAKVTDVRASAAVVRAALELKGVFKQATKQLVDEGGTLLVRIEAELWEDRPTWDRLVSPTRITVFRVRRDRAARRLTMADPAGTVTPLSDFPDPLALMLDVAPVDRVDDDGRYYLHALTTIGSADELGSRDVGDAVFGADEDASGLATIGKFLIRRAQDIRDYLQNITAETTSRKLSGKQIKTPAGSR